MIYLNSMEIKKLIKILILCGNYDTCLYLRISGNEVIFENEYVQYSFKLDEKIELNNTYVFNITDIFELLSYFKNDKKTRLSFKSTLINNVKKFNIVMESGKKIHTLFSNISKKTKVFKEIKPVYSYHGDRKDLRNLLLISSKIYDEPIYSMYLDDTLSIVNSNTTSNECFIDIRWGKSCFPIDAMGHIICNCEELYDLLNLNIGSKIQISINTYKKEIMLSYEDKKNKLKIFA